MRFSALGLSLWVIVCFTSCSSGMYQQIATLESKQVMLKEDGSFVANHDMFTVQYDFWAPSGQVAFWVTNQTDSNLYLDLSESFLVKNGRAYDYYQGRTWVYSGKSSTSVTDAYMSGYSVGSGVVKSTMESDGEIISKGRVQVAANVSESVSLSSMEKGYSVEYVEQPVLCIPAHSSKYIDEFTVSSKPYVECGFPNDPSSKEEVIQDYDSINSPIVIENRLMFFRGETSMPINHVFYVKSLQNISEDDALKTFQYRENCAGKPMPVPVTIHKLAGSNKYYIRYGEGYYENYRNADQ